MLNGLDPPIGVPDRINLGKLYEDCLQGIVILKDSRIVGGRVDKFWGEIAETRMIINRVAHAWVFPHPPNSF